MAVNNYWPNKYLEISQFIMKNIIVALLRKTLTWTVGNNIKCQKLDVLYNSNKLEKAIHKLCNATLEDLVPSPSPE